MKRLFNIFVCLFACVLFNTNVNAQDFISNSNNEGPITNLSEKIEITEKLVGDEMMKYFNISSIEGITIIDERYVGNLYEFTSVYEDVNSPGIETYVHCFIDLTSGKLTGNKVNPEDLPSFEG